MPRRKLDTSHINTTRLSIIQKGYLTQKDIKEFVPCGKDRAGAIYREIRGQIKAEGLENNSNVILAKRILTYLGLTKESIIAGAKMERKGV